MTTAGPSPVRTDHGRRWRAETPAIVAHAASLLAGFVVLLYANRGQWFWGDEWAFLGHRGLRHADLSLWVPHSEHWSTGPILIYRGLYTVFGVRTYIPYIVVLLLIHLAVAHLLWQVMRQAGIDLAVATGLAAIYVLLGAGYENILWAFQIGFVGSVAFGLGAVLLANHDGPFDRRDMAAWALAVAGLMFSGIGVTMVAVVTATVWLRRGIRDAALTAVVPAVVYLVWLALVGRQGLDAQPHTLDSVFAYPDYIWTGLRSAVDQTTGLPGIGPLIVLGLAAWLVRRSDDAAGRTASTYAGALGVLLLFSVIAVGRSALGVQQSEASRYTYIAIALALPAFGLVLHEFAADHTARRGAILFLLVLIGIHNGGVLRDQSRRQADTEKRFRTSVVAAAALASEPGQILLNDRIDPVFNPDLVVDDLRRLALDAKLPAIAVSPADRLTAATVLQYSVGPTALRPPSAPARVERVTGATEDRSRPGCDRLTSSGGGAEVVLAGGAQPLVLTFTSSSGGEISGYLRIRSPVDMTGPPRSDILHAGVATTVTITATVDEVIFRTPATGVTEICGIR